MLAKLQQHADAPINAVLRRHSHILFVLPQASQLASTLPGRKVVQALLVRRQMKAGELGKTALAGNFTNGALAAWVMADAAKSLFESQSTIRNALQTLLAENPQGIALVVLGDAAQRRYAAEIAIYCAWVNGAALPERKKKSERKPLKTVDLYGYLDPHEFPAQRACAEGNVLCRELTVLPPNELTPGHIASASSVLRKSMAGSAKSTISGSSGKWVLVRSAPWPRAARPMMPRSCI